LQTQTITGGRPPHRTAEPTLSSGSRRAKGEWSQSNRRLSALLIQSLEQIET
jgi:hypothetical protein